MLRNMEIYFDDPFEKRSISNEDLQAYTALHLDLLASDGRFPSLAAKTKELQQRFLEASESEDVESLRVNLTTQLTKNLLTVALEVADGSEADKAEALRLFPQRLLEPRGRLGFRGAETDLEVLKVMSPTMAALPKRNREELAESSTSLSS